jgi:hypothetical protein
MSAKPPTPQPRWENYPNLRHRPHSPNKGRGRLQRQIARCFVVFGPEVIPGPSNCDSRAIPGCARV